MSTTITGGAEGGLEGFRQFVLRALRSAGIRFQQRMIRERLSGPTGPNSLSRRTGQLARSVSFNVEQLGRDTMRLSVHAGANAPYADIHEKGGVVYAKHAQNLAIPLAPAKTAAGVSRFASPRLVPNLKFMISRNGNKLLVKVIGKGKSKRIEPWYVLKNRIILPARLGFEKTFKQEIDRLMDDLRGGAAFFFGTGYKWPKSPRSGTSRAV